MVMPRLRGHRAPIVVLGLFAALFCLAAMAWATSSVRRGATYSGRGRQSHFRLPGLSPSSGTFHLQFGVTRDGHQVTRLYVWSLDVICRGRTNGYIEPNPATGSAHIRSDGTFAAEMRALDAAGRRPVTVEGRFLSRGRSSGTLRYRGWLGHERCNADGVWTARAEPPPPPVQHFTGSTEQGTPVTFQRTIERHPQVSRFNFGWLLATTPDGHQCGLVPVTAGQYYGPPPDAEFSLPVRQGSFSGGLAPGNGTDVTISGSFDGKDQATGTVSYADRGDCSTGTVRWTANPAG